MNLSSETILIILGNLGAIWLISVQQSAKLENRFTKLETHMFHLMRKMGVIPREDSKLPDF